MINEQSGGQGAMLARATGYSLEEEKGKSVSGSLGRICCNYQWGCGNQEHDKGVMGKDKRQDTVVGTGIADKAMRLVHIRPSHGI